MQADRGCRTVELTFMLRNQINFAISRVRVSFNLITWLKLVITRSAVAATRLLTYSEYQTVSDIHPS